MPVRDRMSAFARTACSALKHVAKRALGPRKGGGTLVARLAKLGLNTRFDLILHLPLRYEDETRITPINALVDGAFAQIEGDIVSAEVHYRPRRTLIIKLRDTSGVAHLRFLNFYGSQVKQLAEGLRLRVAGDAHNGFFGAEMIHPRYRMVAPDTPFPLALTPVYPTTAGLGQGTLRKLIVNAIEAARRDNALADTATDEIARKLDLVPFGDAISDLHFPAPGTPQSELSGRTHPAWRRMKFDELLAQQLSLQRAYRTRRMEGAPVLAAPTQAHAMTLGARLLGALPFRLTAAQRRAQQEILGDLEASHPMQAAAGRRGQRQDHRRRARGLPSD